MKLNVKVKRINKNIELPQVINKGEWCDLRAAEKVTLIAPQSGTLKRYKADGIDFSRRDVYFDNKLINLGIAMKLPKGFEAYIIPRSGTYDKFGIIQANHIGLIDNSYSGNNDEWKFNAIALTDVVIEEGDRICQFRIQLSQKANIWQKIKWLFCSGIKIIEVESLNYEDRGGFNSTGIK